MMSQQNINQYVYKKWFVNPKNDIFDISLSSDEKDYNQEVVFSNQLIGINNGNRMPIHFDLNNSGSSQMFTINYGDYFTGNTLVSLNYYNPNNDNLNCYTASTLCDIGLTGIDNGLTTQISGETLYYTMGLFTGNSKWNRFYYDRRLKLIPIKSNVKTEPLPFVIVYNVDVNESTGLPDVTLGYNNDAEGAYNGIIYWGDGNYSANTFENRYHIYDEPGIYTITINGLVSGYTGVSGDIRNIYNIIEILSFGQLRGLNNSNSAMFRNCVNLKLDNVADTPDLCGITNCERMFMDCYSLSGIPNSNKWNVSSVTRMDNMFFNSTLYGESTLNIDVSSWDVSNVTNMGGMFHGAILFNSDVSNWDVSNVTNMANMLSGCKLFNQNIGGWVFPKLSNLIGVLSGCESFNQDISGWDVSNINDFTGLFGGCKLFNQDISNWDVSNATNMSGMFYGCEVFNQDISNWDVSNVTNMSIMFEKAYLFNQNIGNWNVSNVTGMTRMFKSAINFNQDISNWDTQKVTNMSSMFMGATNFNQYIGTNNNKWVVSAVTNMESMFSNSSSFNQDIGNWDVSSVKNMTGMFLNAEVFNQNLNGWCVSNVQFFYPEPPNFSTGAIAWTLPKPVWGTCP